MEYVERAQAVGMIEQFNTNRSDLRERRVTRMIEFALKPSLLPDVGSASVRVLLVPPLIAPLLVFIVRHPYQVIVFSDFLHAVVVRWQR